MVNKKCNVKLQEPVALEEWKQTANPDQWVAVVRYVRARLERVLPSHLTIEEHGMPPFIYNLTVYEEGKPIVDLAFGDASNTEYLKKSTRMLYRIEVMGLMTNLETRIDSVAVLPLDVICQRLRTYDHFITMDEILRSTY